MILGLEVRDGTIVAVAASEEGAVVHRSVQRGESASAAAEALRAVGDSGARALGVAVGDPRDPSFSEAISAAADAAGVGVPPHLIGSGGAVALGEQWCGAARGVRHVVALSAAGRVHAGIVADGRLFEGAHGLAGSAAWLALNPVEREDYRRHGCLEAEIGGDGIVRRLVWRLKAGDISRVLDMAAGDMSAITVNQILDAAREGDGVAISVVRDTARYVGMAIGNLVSMADPDVVVLAGVIADAADLLLEPSRAEAVKRMPARSATVVQIVTATLGDDGIALGAARAAMLAT